MVQIASAAIKAESDRRLEMASGTTSSANSFEGNLHPMTPVLLGKTLSRPCSSFSKVATDSHTSRASEIPPSGVPEHTLETLLLMTRAWSGDFFAKRSFPTLMGAPGNYYF